MEFAPHIKALALALKTSRPTIYAWLTLPGCPGRLDNGTFDVKAWQAFAAQRRAARPTASVCPTCLRRSYRTDPPEADPDL